MKRQAESQDVAGSPNQRKVGRKSAPKLKVLCYSCPLMGHVTPTLSLASALAKKGHEVIFVSSQGLAGKVAESCRRSGYMFRGLADAMTAEELRTIHPAEGPVFMDFTEKHGPLLAQMIKVEMKIEKYHSSGPSPRLKSPQNWKPDVVVADFASGAGLLQAKEMQLPLVINVPMPASLLRRVLLADNPLLNYIVSNWIQVGDKHAIQYLGQVAVPALKTAPSIVNSSSALDGRISLPPNFLISGPLDGFAAKPLLPSRHADILQFVKTAKSQAKPLFYITTGSLMDLSKEQVLALYEGFASCDVRVLWSLKDTKRDFLPKPLSADFLIAAWMPQVEILSLQELTAVLTHCGWGGSLECMMAAKPVICFPGFGDQQQNARILNRKGCGPLLKPSSVTAGAVAAAVKDVLTKIQTYQGNARRISDDLRQSPGPEAAVELVEKAVEDGSASSTSSEAASSRCVVS
ncbi:GT7 [Symbiodinium pilosum]|uniref:GT7 protein n=1 Tax=Symbiodinium pilosum TaxID=2952 RepID=A0A812NS91_SYMPI|nr:GT7 [Symbiodinium pilosum]